MPSGVGRHQVEPVDVEHLAAVADRVLKKVELRRVNRVTYHNNGEADYLREGDIRDNFDVTITVFPVRSDTDLFSFQAGVTVGAGRGGDKGRDCRRHRGCDW